MIVDKEIYKECSDQRRNEGEDREEYGDVGFCEHSGNDCVLVGSDNSVGGDLAGKGD